MKLPKYYRPAKRPVCFRLSNGAIDYIKYQCMLHGVTQTMWLNMLLLKMCKQKKDFDPNPYKPTKDELKALAVMQLTKDEKKRHKKTGFAAIKHPSMPRKRSEKKGNF